MIMELIIQNSPISFQTHDMKTLTTLNGIFKLENNDFCVNIIGNNNIYSNCNENNNSTLNINGYEYLLIKEPWFIGGSYWLSSIAMLLYIENNKDLFINKKILELGSGLGLPGMHLARICSKNRVTLSDIENTVTHDSLYVNNMANYDNINNCFIDWNNSDKHNEKYDIIIASDCVYRNTQGIFVDTIKNLLKNDGMLIMFNADRDGIDEFEYSCKELFENIIIETKKLILNDHYFIELLFFQAKY